MKNDLCDTRRGFVCSLGGVSVLGSLGFLSGCGSSGNSVAPLEVIASGVFNTTPENQAATFRNINRIAFTRQIPTGKSVKTLPKVKSNLDSLSYEFDGKKRSIDDYMSINRSSGLIVLKDGAIALERYGLGNTSDTLWTSFSAAKSVTSTLVGMALKDGKISSLDDKVTKYLPQLSGAYSTNTIRDLLRMTSGVRWNETYSETGDSDIVRFSKATSINSPTAVFDVLRSLPRVAEPGASFNYSTGETYVLGAIVAAATGENLSTYFSRKIWIPFGMEADGYWALDSENGLETGGNNFSATLRDYARFGLFFLNGGVVNGTPLLPTGWRELAGQPDNSVTRQGNLPKDLYGEGYPLGYGYQWWSFPTGPDALPYHDGAFTAQGIFGQFIYVNPKEKVVAVVWSAWREGWQPDSEFETYTLLSNAIAALS
jgi:CubicO group peptidase (beta-lactamase class C family)